MATRRVIWKPRAIEQVREIQIYIQTNFGKTTLGLFTDALEEATERLNENPELGRQTSIKTVRRLKIYKKTSLFYRLQGGFVVIHRVLDDRRDPFENPELRR